MLFHINKMMVNKDAPTWVSHGGPSGVGSFPKWVVKQGGIREEIRDGRYSKLKISSYHLIQINKREGTQGSEFSMVTLA